MNLSDSKDEGLLLFMFDGKSKRIGNSAVAIV
jgi:hypothetical protein